jgi:hypothetical protein
MHSTLTPLESQLAELQAAYAGASARSLPSGAWLITVPSVRLPSGWSKGATMIQFVAPVGFPHAQPDCFWADADLRLAGGGMPQNSRFEPIPEVGSGPLWFSWHLSGSWNANRDTMMTWMAVIRSRLKDVR